MQIYANEQHLSNINLTTVVAECQLQKRELNDNDKKLLHAVASEYDADLYPVSTILVSTNWNGNDDVFVKNEVVNAKCSPEHKPLNKEHKSRAIVGHITRSEVVDDDYNVLYSEDDYEDCNILAEGVVYRHLGTRDEELKEETDVFIKELEDGEWYVSMETRFNDFDYAIQHPTLGSAIIKRSDDNSFLTQYLRAYGGTGQYKDFKIGRVLRGLIFSAEGFVKNPANPKSLVLNSRKFTAASQSASEINIITEITKGANIMNEFEAKYNDAQKIIDELRAELAKATKEQSVQERTKLENTIAELNKNIEDKDSAITELTSEAKDNKVALDKANEQVVNLQKQLDEATAELKKIEEAKIHTDRVSAMVDVGVDKAEAETLVQKFKGVNDEQFTALVELRKSQATIDNTTDDVELDETGETSVDNTTVDATAEDNTTLASTEDAELTAIASMSEFFKQKLVIKK